VRFDQKAMAALRAAQDRTISVTAANNPAGLTWGSGVGRRALGGSRHERNRAWAYGSGAGNEDLPVVLIF
jgi:hypothetical protein